MFISDLTMLIFGLALILWGLLIVAFGWKAFLMYFRSRHHSLQYFASSAQFNFFEWNLANDQVSLFGHDPKVKAFYKKGQTNYQEILQIIHPDDRQNFSKMIERFKNNKTEFDSLEYRVRLPDTIRWVSLHATVREYKKERLLNGYIQDVTDFKKDYLEQKIISQQYQALLEQGNIGFWHWDLQSSQLKVSASFSRLFHITTHSETYPSEFLTEQIWEGDRASVHRHFLSLINGEKQVGELDFRIHCVDKIYRWVKCKCSVFQENEAGQALSLVGILMDVDEQQQIQHALKKSESEARKLAEELKKKMVEAEAASKLKSAFLANMSHEIRTPLNAIIGMTEVIKEGPLNESQRYYMDIVTHAGDNLLVLINDILDSSKIDAGEITIVRKLFDIRTMISRAVELVSFRYRSKDVVFSYVVGDEVETMIEGDEFRLYQVLLNLLGNAGKFTDKGEVCLMVHSQEHPFGGELVFHVVDTGRGIPEHELGNIFNVFSQVHVDSKKLIEGTGLGLSIAKRILTLMNGKISVQSTLGCGSTFTASVPYAQGLWDMTHPGHQHLQLKKLWLANAHPLENEAIDLQLRRDHVGAVYQPSLDLPVTKDVDLLLIDWTFFGQDLLQEKWREEHRELFDRIIVLMPADFHPLLPDTLPRDIPYKMLHRPFTRHKLAELTKDINNKAQSPFLLADHGGISNCSVSKDQFLLPAVLAVDDSESNLELIKLILKDHVARIDTACNGIEALERFKSNSYQLVLMDIQMPELDGHQAFKKIRDHEKQENKSPTPIWAVTAFVHDEAIAEIKATGFDLYFNKPIKRKAFLQVLESNFKK